VQALAKIQIPFQKISLKPSYEIETLVQTPLAVAATKFAYEVSKDCQDFLQTMQQLQDKSVQIQIADYDDIRFRALPLSMKANYEILLEADKSFNLEPAFDLALIEKYHLSFNFSKAAVSLKSVQEKAHQYISSKDDENQISLHFKSRDLFCDYYYGKLQIVAKADLLLQTNSLLQSQTEEKLQKLLNHLNDGFMATSNPKIQAAYLGSMLLNDFKSNWKEKLQLIFSDLIDKNNLIPSPFWAEKKSDFYSLNFSKLHNISQQNIYLKGKFNE
jgi:hypothetical protein